jgi:hypothetical protein
VAESQIWSFRKIPLMEEKIQPTRYFVPEESSLHFSPNEIKLTSVVVHNG